MNTHINTRENHMRALALVGMPGAGKSLCAAHLEQLGFFQFRFGGIVVNEVARRGLPLTPDTERLVRFPCCVRRSPRMPIS
jgi:dephospho-CoA kinase